MPHPFAGDWPRHCSRTRLASLLVSCGAPVCYGMCAGGLARDENGFAALGRLRSVIGLRIGREAAGANISAIFAHGARDDLAQVGVLPRELRRLVEGKAQQIVQDENLAVAIRAGADADRRNV